jgi:dipeptidase E
MKKRLLLLSNSTNPGETYLGWPLTHIKDFLGENVKSILFIPYAGVTISYDEYYKAVSDQLSSIGYELKSVHNITIAPNLLSDYDAIVVGGGNTFQLINLLQQNELIKPIREAVMQGIPYIGWSAGSNIASPTIKTTNDMPIVEPATFEALNLLPFQINPHYTEAIIPNHGGESRAIRLQEFITLNHDTYVAGIPEGSLLRLEKERLYFVGQGNCRIYKYGTEVLTYKDGDDLSWLLR